MPSRAFHPGKGPQRRESWRAKTHRFILNEALLGVDRPRSIAQTQGAFSSIGANGVTFPALEGGGINWWIDVTVTDVDPALAPVEPLAGAVGAAEQTALTSLKADWGRDGFAHPLADLSDAVSEVSIERSITGDLPEEAGLVEGQAAAQLTATISGTLADGVTEAVDALAPYRADSALYRRPLLGSRVECDLGLATDAGPILLPQFRGQLRSLRVSSSSREVGLAALDPADTVRAPITLPAYGMDRGDFLASNHRFDANTQAVIDYVLRKNGIYASTAPHPQAQISCTGHGWLAAEIGRSSVPRGVAAATSDPEWWVPGPFDMLAVRGIWDGHGSYQEFYAREPFIPTAGRGLGVACWMRVGNDMGLPPATGRVMFELFPLVSNSELRYTLEITSSGGLGGFVIKNGVPAGFVQPINTTTRWQYVALHFANRADGTTEISFRQNGITTAGAVATPTFSSVVQPFMQVTAWQSRDWSNFHVWFEPERPQGAWPGETELNQANLDPGLNLLTHLPDVVGADSWAVIQEAARAEYGLVGFDEGGRFFFRNRNRVTTPATVEKEISADLSLIDLSTQVDADAVRNVVSTETSAGYLDFNNVIFESQSGSQFDCLPGVRTFDIALPFSAIGTNVQELPQILSANWNDQQLWGYVAVDADNPAVEIPLSEDLTVRHTMTGDRQGRLTVRNNTIFKVRFATTSGQPALRVQGWLLERTPAAVEFNGSQGSVDTYGLRSLSIPASPYRQLLAPLRPVALGLLAQLSNPVPVIDQVPVNGDPRVQLGDTVRLVDPTGNGSLRATVVKINRTISDGKLSDSLTVRPIGAPGLFLLDDPELGVLDSTVTVLAP